jgi:hypothetical protein
MNAVMGGGRADPRPCLCLACAGQYGGESVATQSLHRPSNLHLLPNRSPPGRPRETHPGHARRRKSPLRPLHHPILLTDLAQLSVPCPAFCPPPTRCLSRVSPALSGAPAHRWSADCGQRCASTTTTTTTLPKPLLSDLVSWGSAYCSSGHSKPWPLDWWDLQTDGRPGTRRGRANRDPRPLQQHAVLACPRDARKQSFLNNSRWSSSPSAVAHGMHILESVPFSSTVHPPISPAMPRAPRSSPLLLTVAGIPTSPPRRGRRSTELLSLCSLHGRRRCLASWWRRGSLAPLLHVMSAPAPAALGAGAWKISPFSRASTARLPLPCPRSPFPYHPVPSPLPPKTPTGSVAHPSQTTIYSVVHIHA